MEGDAIGLSEQEWQTLDNAQQATLTRLAYSQLSAAGRTTWWTH
ncbi:hypothetical protein [Pseudoalteromonas luteoviolacea]|uniref:Uncharacterized protein n=1 Tax=Pseudoalteromonas luteoviolacea NCIMB 1942 TaxID=1365253 RepID=A0A167CJQ8_9GAMM|nr:hypothetical protein [Pseudoalteromonas luteoviolacea]KZN47744.1 hypothetical protein N482_08960 [Pseudoalteromonas luteoviolacea NCIMB 1942]